MCLLLPTTTRLTPASRPPSAPPTTGLIGIPGSEITSAAGHVLALGIHERVPAGLSFGETLSAIRD